ncbi:MAG: M1 family metallopeptidase, partial [Anaerolineae bacterium]|nr:M1 family metallopeptidase [Anaerolineae bacterium]
GRFIFISSLFFTSCKFIHVLDDALSDSLLEGLFLLRKLIASFLTFSLLLVSCSIPQPTATPPPTEITPDPLKTPWEDRSIFKDGLVSSQQPVLNELTGASIYHIEFTITDDLYHITGTEEVRYTNNEDVELGEVQFHLFPNILGGEMNISSMRVNDNEVDVSYELENSVMRVPLQPPLLPGQSAILRMDFAVTVPQSLESNYGVLAYVDDVLTLAHSYPMIAVYDHEGWNTEIPSQQGDVTYADASFYIVRVTAPQGLTLVTSGHRVSLSEVGQAQTLIVASGPARDFYLAASPHYAEISQTFGEVTIRSYAPKESADGAQMALDVASRAIKDFSTHYAPYPYTEFDIVSTPTLALGIEYPGAVAITSRIYDVNGEYRGAPASIYMESTVAHEVGHQWFYNLVGDDQLDDPWIDESLTQYATLQYYTDEYGASGADGFRTSLEGRWERVGNAKIPIGLPVADYQDVEYSAIVYGRGPLFFVALKDVMGAEVFDKFLMDYADTFSWKIATPEALQSLAEKHCSCDLDSIFNEWVY